MPRRKERVLWTPKRIELDALVNNGGSLWDTRDIQYSSSTRREPSGLTVMQENFCRWFVLTGDPTTAYVKAGYSTHTSDGEIDTQTRFRGQKLANSRRIIRRCEEIRQAMDKELSEFKKVTAEKIVDRLYTVFENALNEGKFSDANRALELLGKHLGMFAASDAKTAEPPKTIRNDEDREKIFKQVASMSNLIKAGSALTAQGKKELQNGSKA